MELYHNPRCTKSRQALQLLQDKELQFQIIEYLKEVPTKEELTSIISKLGISAEQLMRKNENIFKEHYKGKDLSEEEWINAMLENPKLIERPILVNGDKAVIGRPPEDILSII